MPELEQAQGLAGEVAVLLRQLLEQTTLEPVAGQGWGREEGLASSGDTFGGDFVQSLRTAPLAPAAASQRTAVVFQHAHYLLLALCAGRCRSVA